MPPSTSSVLLRAVSEASGEQEQRGTDSAKKGDQSLITEILLLDIMNTPE